jgi:hypothetical protein
MPCELIERSFFLSFFLLLSHANLFMALHFLQSCFGICDLSIYILVGCEVCAVSQFWCFKLSNYDKWWGYHRHPDRLHFHMVMPADRLFTRKYLKYLFPKAHIEMARYTIHDSSEWVYWIFCFLSVLCGFYWQRFCPQLSIWCVMIEWRCFSKKCEQCHLGLFIDITCKKFQNNSSVLYIASNLEAMNSLLKFTFSDRPLLTMCVCMCVFFLGGYCWRCCHMKQHQ